MNKKDIQLLTEAYRVLTRDELFSDEDILAFLGNPDEELSDAGFEKAFEYYMNTGEMPYGTMKARTGDPHPWVEEHLLRDYEELYAQDPEDNMSDIDADADTLASAGYGTDEDYGSYGGDNY